MRRSVVAAVVVVALFVGSGTSFAQYGFVSPGGEINKGLREHFDRQEEQRRYEQHLALEKRRVELQEKRYQQSQPVAPDAQQVIGSLTRERLTNLVDYLRDIGLTDDQLKDVLSVLLLD